MAGEVFSIGDREYEMAEFDVVSLLDHSIFTIKLPVQISSFAEETYPRYGLKVTIHGESTTGKEQATPRSPTTKQTLATIRTWTINQRP